MVFKSSSVLSCLLPARLGFGSHNTPDPPRDHTRHLSRAHHSESHLDPFRGHHGSDSRTRPNTAQSDSLPAPILISDGGIGESPNPAHLARQKRSSFTTFFAFSSKRKSTHGAPIIHLPRLQQDLLSPHPVPGRWASDPSQTEVHVINPTSVPSPLLGADDEEYYYAYYTSLTSPSSRLDLSNISPSKQPSLRQHDLSGNRDLDSQLSSPVDSHPSHTQIHPYSYSTPLDSKSINRTLSLRHTSSQPFQHHPRSESNTGLVRDGTQPSHSKNWPHLLQPHLKASVSTPNLASGATPLHVRSVIKKKPPGRSKGQERWLSAESWWDALLSPSPRFKVKQAPRPHTATGRIIHGSMNKPAEGEPNRIMATPLSPARPRAVSATSNVRPPLRTLTRSRSAADLLRRPSTSGTMRTGFEPALETLVDDPASTSTIDQVPGSDVEHPLPDPSLSLEQVIDEREAFEQQRAKWKQQASKSLGNRHTRSVSRARSKSFNERHAHVHHSSEGTKAHSNFGFLAARTLLGSQSTMPVVHITKPSMSSSHSKAYSHSHSYSAHSHTQTSHSHAYSHSHSHSLTTSNSSKSSRHPPRGHSRNESWSKTALLKAGALCGINQDESCNGSGDEKLPSSSRTDALRPSDATDAQATTAVSPTSSVPSGEVGIAITSSPSEGCFDHNKPGHSGSQHQEGDQESRWSSNFTKKSSDYAGPHPSVVDSILPQPGVSSNISLRHRLPPRAVIHPPIVPIAHPYRSVSAQPDRVVVKEGQVVTLKITEGQDTAEKSPDRFYPHVSLSNADFESYGVGEALVYASAPRPEEIREVERASEESKSSSRATELPPSARQSTACETVVLRPENPDGSSMATNSPPSLTNSTIQMVMSAFDNPDDFDEFKDLFYKPLPAAMNRTRPSVTISQVPTDIHSSASSSPLTHLVRKLSEEVQGWRDASRTPSEQHLQRSESEDHRSNHSGTKFVFMDVARSSSSPQPMESSSQTHLPIQKDNEPPTQPIMVIPEDVNSSYTASILESPLEDQENDTFGYPIKHGELEAVTAPTPVQSPVRVSTHLSVEQGENNNENDHGLLSPLTARSWLSSADAARSSYLTTSDLSHMSRLSDFPLPPGMHPGGQPGHTSILRAYREAMPPTSEIQDQQEGEDADEVEEDGNTDDEGDTSGDVEETLRVLRMPLRATSYESHRTTFGGSDDMDFVAQLHQPSS